MKQAAQTRICSKLLCKVALPKTRPADTARRGNCRRNVCFFLPLCFMHVRTDAFQDDVTQVKCARSKQRAGLQTSWQAQTDPDAEIYAVLTLN